MNVQQVYESLAFTVQADAELRKRAEALLLQAQIAPGFLSCLLQITASKDSKPEIAQAAAVYFKNRIKEGWSASQSPLQPDEKTWLKQHILQGIAQAQPNNKTLLLASISIMISNEHSTGTWPELMPSVVQLVNSQDPNLMNTGLCVLLEWTKNYQMQVSKREPLNIMVQNLFPNLLTIANKLEPMFNHLDALFMLKTILKIYSCSIRMELSNALQSPDSLIPWGTLFLAVVSRQVPDGTFNFPNDADERAKHIWWKCKKWAYSCLNNLMGRYGRGGKTNKRYAGFSKLFLNQFAPKIFEVFYQQLELTMTGVWMSPRVTQLSLTFLEHCIKPKSTWGLFQARLDTIIANFIFPQLCFSESDLELWNEDPVEYIHKKIDPTIDDFRSPVTAATELLGTLVRGRFKVAFVPIVTIINNILTTLQSSYNPRQKYGALTMMGCISEMALSEQSPIGSQMESFLVTHVFPDLNSNETYLRAKACDIINSYSNVTFSQQSNLEFVFQTILQRLSDEELPVRVSASLTLAPLLKYPQVKEAIKPHVVQVMQGLLNTTNEIDLDTLTHTMEILVFEFSEELKPFAIQLATQLRDTFMRIMSEANFTSDEFNIDEVEDKTMAAMGVLKTISSLILSVETSLEILLGIEEVVVPALLFILDNSILDLYEEVFEIIETCIFCSKQVSQNMWNVFPRIYATFKSDALEYLEEMLPSLDNYITFGKDVFIQSQDHQNQLMDIVLTVMTDQHSREADRIRSAQLMETMMLNLRGAIDQHIPKFIEQAFKYLALKKIKTSVFRVHCLEIIINALYYNPILTFQILDQTQWTGSFLELWFKNIEAFSRVHDKKLCIVTLCTILELPVESLPQQLSSNWTHLFDGVLQVFKTYPAALEEREMQENNDGEGDDEDFGDQDFDDYADEDFNDDQPNHESVTQEESLQSLAAEASSYAPTADESDDEEWEVEDFLQEDIYFMTPLDSIDSYARLAQTMTHLSSTGQGSILDSRLTNDQRLLLQQCVEKATKLSIKQ